MDWFHTAMVAIALSCASQAWSAATATSSPQSELPKAVTSDEKTVSKNSSSDSSDKLSQSSLPKRVAAVEEPSEAERIADLHRTIGAEEKRLKEIEAELISPDGEYSRAENEFQEIDRELDAKKDMLKQFKKDGKVQAAALLEKEIRTLEKEWSLAKDRFDLAIDERKTQREEIVTLRQKIQKDHEALNDLTGADEPETSKDSTLRTAHAEMATDKVTSKGESKTAQGAAAHFGMNPLAGPEPDHSAGGEKAESDGAAKDDSDGPPDEELMQAVEDAKQKEVEAHEAQEDVKSIALRIADLQKIIVQEQKVLAFARKKADLALSTQQTMDEELATRRSEAAAPEELLELRDKIADAKNRFVHARQEVIESTDRLNEKQSELASLQSQQIIALQEADQKRQEAKAAEEKVADLRNPFSLRNLLQWLIDHGPKVLGMLLAMIIILQTIKVFGHRIIKLMVGSTGRGSTIERENRAQTLVGVFQNAASVAIIVGGSLMVLDEMEVKVGVLLGGVAVVGLAVAFGAQNLIKDYFYGFVMLLENQYMINDVIKIGDLSGQVERITLRMTVLRDANGVVHFIPNGTINSVSNETHGWSRAAFEIGVAYKEDIDQVIRVLSELGRQLRQDANFGPMILDDPTPPGVDALGDSAVVVKFFVKTRPNQQGSVKRELLRRIKNKFDELGIELPFPHRTLYHRYEEGTLVPEPLAQLKKCA